MGQITYSYLKGQSHLGPLSSPLWESLVFTSLLPIILVMKSSVYVAYCSMISFLLISFYGEVKEHLASPEPYLRQIDVLRADIKKEELKHFVTAFEFEDFRQYVGTLLPGVIKEKGPGEKSYPYRSLASVTQKSSSETLNIQKAKDVFENGRSEFRSNRYAQAIESFDKLITQHPYSAYLTEAMFLKLESHFQLRQFDGSIAIMEKMVDLFPSSELTGYAILRVGKIYELQDRYDEAVALYQTVLKSFPDRGLAAAAAKHLQ